MQKVQTQVSCHLVFPRFCADDVGQRQLSWILNNMFIRQRKNHVEETLSNQIQSPIIQCKEGPNIEQNNDIERKWKEKYLLLLSVLVCVVEPSNIPWAKYITPPAPAPHVEKTKENPTLKR